MSVGFLGIQCGFGLQNANASRILQTFGADVHELSWFWLVAPITGMIVQPLVGHYSDKTWGRLGRRRPYFLIGAVLAAIGMCIMPNSAAFASYISALWVGAGMLFMMDASINVAMEPFRALVADKLSTDQRTAGFAIQTILIGLGAVIGSKLPSLLVKYFGVANTAGEGIAPPSVVFSFYIGAAILLAAILWTIITTSEYSPEDQLKYSGADPALEKEATSGLGQIFKDFASMPKTMKQLGLVQFFSWFALFSMWVFCTPALAQHVWGLPVGDTHSEAYNEAANWVGEIFSDYNLVATVYAFLLPFIAGKIGRKNTHAFSLICGGIGLMSIYLITGPENKELLSYSMIGVGIAWASILAMPYAILAGSIPPLKMGIYMGIFNFFITGPQILNGLIGGPIVKYFYGGESVYALVVAGIVLIVAAVSVIFVDDVDEVKKIA